MAVAQVMEVVGSLGVSTHTKVVPAVTSAPPAGTGLPQHNIHASEGCQQALHPAQGGMPSAHPSKGGGCTPATHSSHRITSQQYLQQGMPKSKCCYGRRSVDCTHQNMPSMSTLCVSPAHPGLGATSCCCCCCISVIAYVLAGLYVLLGSSNRSRQQSRSDTRASATCSKQASTTSQPCNLQLISFGRCRSLCTCRI
jgi:hypothetical protein